MGNDIFQETKFKEVEPSKEIINQVKVDAEKINYSRRRTERKFLKPVAAMAAFLLMAAVGFGIFYNSNSGEDYSYYTVDINPSIILKVNNKQEVLEVKYLNNDAEEMLEGQNLIGQIAKDAIKNIISKAEETGYFSEEERYVLVGHFDEDGKENSSELQESLETEFSDLIELVFVEGTVKDKEEADKLDVSPGLLKLSKLADDVNIKKDEKVDEIIDKVIEENKTKFKAPTFTANDNNGNLNLFWNQLNFDEIGYTGEMKYHIVYASDEKTIASKKGSIFKTNIFNTNSESSLSYTVTSDQITPGSNMYYALYAEYSDGTMIVSNILELTMPKDIEAEDPTEDKLLIEGKAYDKYIKLTWTKSEKALTGYKIVASSTKENPTYPEDGYIKYITDVSTTSANIYPSSKLINSKEYNFAITYVFEDGTKEYSTSVKLKMPNKEVVTPTPEPSDSYPSSDISAVVDGNKVYLNWESINHENFTGYKVMYSYEHANPVYDERGYYADWITTYTNTEKSFDLTTLKGYQGGKKVYFSISTLYNGHDDVIPGNVVSVIAPSVTIPDYVGAEVSGSLDGDTVYINWNKVEHPHLKGYKILYSFTDSELKYGVKGTAIKYVTDLEQTTFSFPVANLIGYEPGATMYVSISTLYTTDVIEPGNSKSFKMPESEPEAYISPIIRKEMTGSTYVTISWNEIEHSALNGYLMKYSYSPFSEGSAIYVFNEFNKDATTTTIPINDFSSNGENDVIYVKLLATYNNNGNSFWSNELEIPVTLY